MDGIDDALVVFVEGFARITNTSKGLTQTGCPLSRKTWIDVEDRSSIMDGERLL